MKLGISRTKVYLRLLQIILLQGSAELLPAKNLVLILEVHVAPLAGHLAESLISLRLNIDVKVVRLAHTSLEVYVLVVVASAVPHPPAQQRRRQWKKELDWLH